MRELVAGAVIAGSSWLCLAIGLGNIGLQRSIAAGPGSILESPVTMLMVAVASFGLAVVITGRARSIRPVRLSVAVMLWDVIAAVVIAPVAVGELTPSDAPVVFAVLAALGIQPVACLLGAIAGRRRHDSRRTATA